MKKHKKLNNTDGEVISWRKHAKRLADSLEMLYGIRACKICGYEPEKQQKMIEEVVNRAYAKGYADGVALAQTNDLEIINSPKG